MLFRSFPVLLACLSLAACAAPSPDADADVTETSESGLGSLSSMLRSQTALDRARALDAETGSVAVEYAPAEAEAYLAAAERRVAFEAVTFEGSASDGAAEINVAGDFPSSATVIVTNDRFEPLAVSRTVRSPASNVATAAVRVPAGDGNRFVLVRDPKWVKPMTFEVSVRGSGR